MAMLYRSGGPAGHLMLPAPPPPPCRFVRFVRLLRARPIQMLPRAPPLLLCGGAGVHDVWAGNLHQEFSLIASLLPRYPCVCVDTEFPGTVHDSDTPLPLRGPRERYALVKKNVDDLKLLQVGITLSGPTGRCPVSWQFNLRGFDASCDPHAAASIDMLREQGMDFDMLRDFGVDPEDFRHGFFRSGLGCRRLSWAAFSGSYDFAYLIKVLSGGRPLPDTVEEFLAHVHMLFGPAVLDVKILARFCGDGIRGGLDQVATELGLERAAGRAHCAGSDSMLTCDVLQAMVNRFFREKNVLMHAGAIADLI